MKTFKENSQTEKIPEGMKTVKNKKTKIIIQSPEEEEIREKAIEIYYQRIDRGENGTAVDDWLEAEKSLRDDGAGTSGTI
jgi:hypothetical protein